MPRKKASERTDAPYRIKAVAALTGVSRETIRYYINEGLLPPPVKSARNMGWYTDRHVELLRLIQKLQAERFLPLKAIRAVLDGEAPEAKAFTPAQRDLIRRVGASLRGTLLDHSDSDVSAAVQQGRIPLDDVRELEAAHAGDLRRVPERQAAAVIQDDGDLHRHLLFRHPRGEENFVRDRNRRRRHPASPVQSGHAIKLYTPTNSSPTRQTNGAAWTLNRHGLGSQCRRDGSHADIDRQPLGSGIDLPSSRATSIQPCIASRAIASASSYVPPCV